MRDFDSGDEGGPRAPPGGPRAPPGVPRAPPGVHRGDRGMDRGSSSGGGFGSGRWQRGVKVPDEDVRGRSGGRSSHNDDYDAENPDDLWDDPLGGGPVGAASDFSAFGGSLEDDHPKGKTEMEAFDLGDMSAAAAAFENELHGDKSNGKSNNDDANGGIGGALEDDDEDGVSHNVDPSRPLAGTGTTIRSGSGDHVNVFEDFGDEEKEEEEKEEDIPIKSGTGTNSASSRLMNMIGVSGTGEASGSAEEVENPAEEEKPPEEEETKPRADSIPNNPWGAPAATSVSSNPWGGPAVDPAATQRQQEEELRRKQQQQKEEEEKRWAEMQAKQKAEMEHSQAAAKQCQEQEGQVRQQQSQVELVLIERISNILENSWGRSDLNSILSTLHADDSRVIAILSTVEALRSLIARHPDRIQMGRDPTMGAEMAALRLTNAQWKVQQAQQQAQKQAQEQELLRQKKLQEEQARAELEEEERNKQQLQQQQSAPPPVVTDAPWYYADPQGNIQGPFGGDEMRQWLEAGYFKGDLPISQNSSGPFRTLNSYFSGDASNAFKPTIDRQAEAEQARAAAEAEKLAREKVEAEAQAAREAAARGAEEKSKVEQSSQLKMMLGIGGGESSSIGIAGPPQPEPVTATPTAPPPAKKHGTKTQKKEKPAAPVVEQAPVDDPEPSAPPAPAWGGASSETRTKSMSEIQQEEAREATRRVKEQGITGGPGGGGWANIAATGGSSAWGGAAGKNTAAGVVTPAPQVAGLSTTAKKGGAAWNSSKPTVMKNAQSNSTATSKKTAVDNFGANGRMTPTLETWCKGQMQKINGSDDLTLVQFCMTLTDSDEIRQYLTAYLGSTPPVNNFATEFIKKKGGDNGQQEEWASIQKKGGRKKAGGRK